ncbi:unnamed protein product [Boreogadus saida]
MLPLVAQQTRESVYSLCCQLRSGVEACAYESDTLLSRNTIFLSFSSFSSLSAFTLATRSRMDFCCSLTAVCQQMAGLLTTVSHLVPLGLLHLWPRYSSKDGQAVTPSGDIDLLCTPLRSRSLPFLTDRVGLIRIHYMELVCTDTSLESYGEVHKGVTASSR